MAGIRSDRIEAKGKSSGKEMLEEFERPNTKLTGEEEELRPWRRACPGRGAGSRVLSRCSQCFLPTTKRTRRDSPVDDRPSTD